MDSKQMYLFNSRIMGKLKIFGSGKILALNLNNKRIYFNLTIHKSYFYEVFDFVYL